LITVCLLLLSDGVQLSDHTLEIREITGIGQLVNLKVLWIGGNLIEHIAPDTFDNNQQLVELNIAGNLIGQFKEIPLFDRIKSLESLSMKCANFAENPVCSLCNYQTYALYHLTRIKKLDSLLITDDARHIADATFLKKKMYYNMRIKTLKRNATNVLNNAKQMYTDRCNDCSLNLNVLLRMRRELEREIEEAQYLPKWDSVENASSSVEATDVPPRVEEDDNYMRQVKSKYNIISNEIKKKLMAISDLNNYLKSFTHKVNMTAEMSIGRLLLELDTGGNIRLEEGKVGDVWYHSCVDLIKSRFFASDFKVLGYSSLNVHRVTRIHNRYLRNRFEKRLDEAVDTSDNAYKRSLEYLFYGEGLDPDTDIFSIVEDGFPSAESYTSRGFDSAVTLSNSVSICEIPRIQTLLSQDKTGSKLPVTIKGSLLIAKVFLGSFKAEKKSASRPGSSANEPTATGIPNAGIKPDQYGSSDSVYRTKAGDPKQRKWFIFDHKLILPEYLVEYEFVPTTVEGEISPFEQLQEMIIANLEPKSDIDILDIRSHAAHYAEFHSFCSQLELQAEQESDIMSTALSMPPNLIQRKKISMMSRYTITQTARCTSLSNITYLNLYGNNIRKIECLDGLTNLKTLILSFNEIDRIEGLDGCSSLERLELDFNLIKKLEGLDNLGKLRVLHLNNNLLYRVEDVLALHAKSLPDMRELSLSNNAICEVPSYRYIIIRRLQQLVMLDDAIITNEDRLFAVTQLHVITDELVRAAVNSKSRNLSYSLSYKTESQATLTPVSDDWALGVQELDLSGKRLRRITNLEKLVNLKRLNLSRNEISRMEHLHDHALLQELNLEDNRITKIEGLSALMHLRKLELASNKISKLENLDLCVRLTQLSLEGNHIESLSGVEKLVNLMELYLANNRVRNLQEVLHLKSLTKLIILDLSGNTICMDKSYRLYTVFNLKKLKVLDGVSIDANESQHAREEFSGKVTTDILREVLGEMDDFSQVNSLNLSSSSIKHLSNTTGPLFEKFHRLSDLNLQNNNITSLNGLNNVSDTLVYLNLDNNRLGETNVTPNNNTIGRYFDKLVNLQVLSLEDNHLTNMICLELKKLRSLRVLNLNRNEITKIDGLQGVSETLKELYLNRNKIRFLDHSGTTAVSELSFIPNLQILQIEENGVRSLDGITHLTTLVQFGCSSNRIGDMGELEKLTELSAYGYLRDISLAFNPVSRKSIYRPTVIHYCPSLITLDGKEISTEERQRSAMFFNQDYYQTNTSSPNVFTSPSPQNNPTAVVVSQDAQDQMVRNSQNQMRQSNNSRVPVRIAAVSFDYANGNSNGNGAHNSVTPAASTATSTTTSTPPIASATSPNRQDLTFYSSNNMQSNTKNASEQATREIERYLSRAGRKSSGSSRSSNTANNNNSTVPSTMPRTYVGSLGGVVRNPTLVVKRNGSKVPVKQQAYVFPSMGANGGTPRTTSLFPKV
jgi:Leucine-rich repeat (LRR) protein